MVSKFDFCITAGSHNIRTVVWTDSSVYRSHPTMPWIDSEKQAYLATKLLSNTIPIWEHLILDAKDYLLRDRSRESLISLNSAFENFISIYCKNHLMKTMSQEEADDYIMGKPMYKDFFLMNYLSEEAYNAALQNGDITNFPPTTYQILKRCNSSSSLGISNSKLQKLISKIRANRNDIVHGREISPNQVKIAREAIEAFELFKNLFI